MNGQTDAVKTHASLREKILEKAYKIIAYMLMGWMLTILVAQILFLYCQKIDNDTSDFHQSLLNTLPVFASIAQMVPTRQAPLDNGNPGGPNSGGAPQPASTGNFVGLSALLIAVAGFFMAKFVKHLDAPTVRGLEPVLLTSVAVLGTGQFLLYFFMQTLSNPDAGMIDGYLIQQSLVVLVERNVSFVVLLLGATVAVKA